MNVATDEGGDIGGFLISHEINYPVHAYNEKAMVQLETEIPGTTGGLNTFLINAKEKLPIEKLTIVEEYLAGLNKQKINELAQMPIFLQN
jgi:hypothetical protein